MTTTFPIHARQSQREFLTDYDWKAIPTSPIASVKAGSQRDLTYTLEGRGQLVITIDGALPEATHHRILEVIDLLKLPENWDSFGAKQIKPMIGVSALNFLLYVMPKSSPSPSVVPTTEGGVQLEWHRNGVDFELTFCGDDTIQVWFEDLRTGNETECTIQDNFEPIIPLFERLSSSH